MIPLIQPYTMVDTPRLEAVLRALDKTAEIPGAFVECGVWRGGVCMLAALRMLETGNLRDIYLFDTFSGMPLPTPEDGSHAVATWAPDWCKGELDDVRANMASTGYPQEKIHYVVGKVEETLPFQSIHKIAILRLDTDWYSSTKAELTHLYPRLQSGGSILIDDYWHWEGCRNAVNEYFLDDPLAPEFTKDDYTGVSGTKP
jgi:hypothetical protein